MKYLGVPQSGSQAGVTASRNRNGQYFRSRAIPVNPRSASQGQVRARLSANSATWRTLDAATRAGWTDLASSFHRKDALGQDYTPTGFQMFVSVNNNRLNAGDAVVAAAPALVTPPALLTAVATTVAGTLSVAYTATPLAAGNRVFAFASPQRSAGRAFESDLRLISVSAAAAASPLNLLSAYTAKFGAPVLTNRIFFSLQVYAGGFMSGPIITSVVVSA
jgi:hypothetical protein